MKKQHWKWLFFLLLGCNIVLFAIIFILLSIPAEDQEIPEFQSTEKDNVSFIIKTNKNDLNQVMNKYLANKQTGNTKYLVVLEKDGVILSGKLPVFNNLFDIKMTFKPIELENGDLILEQEKISIGKISLPVSFVLNIIKGSYQFPEWVIIQPDHERVYVSFQNMKVNQDSRILVNKFDLSRDDIEFMYIVPVK